MKKRQITCCTGGISIRLLVAWLLLSCLLNASTELPRPPLDPSKTKVSHPNRSDPVQVYVLPIHGLITSAQLYIVRRGLRAALEKGVDAVVVDIDTPGGDLQTTLELMEVLNRFDGETMSFVRKEAISAGVYISVSTEDIYFAPKSVIGSAAIVQGTGQDVPDTMKMKLESYLMARVRAYAEEYPHRVQVVQAMMKKEFVLELDEKILKTEGELLSLTAKQAMVEYGNPPSPLLGSGIYDDVKSMLDDRYGPGKYIITEFEVTWSEDFAKFMNNIAPLLLGIGLLGLFIEFKTPGFGVFGVTGIALLLIVFASNYIAGLAGHEEILFFLLGVGLIMLEVFLFPGIMVLAITGAFLVLGSLIWAMADYWPGHMGDMPPGDGTLPFLDFGFSYFLKPAADVMLGFLIAVVGAVFMVKFLPRTLLWDRIVLQEAVGNMDPMVSGGGSAINQDPTLPGSGAAGVAMTDLFPSGEVEIDGRRYQARVNVGTIPRGFGIRVTGQEDFCLLVEESNT